MNDLDKIKATLGQHLQRQEPAGEPDPKKDRAYWHGTLSEEEEAAYRQSLLGDKKALDRLLAAQEAPQLTEQDQADEESPDPHTSLAQFKEHFVHEEPIPMPLPKTSDNPRWPTHLLWLAACICTFFLAKQPVEPQGVESVVRLPIDDTQRGESNALVIERNAVILLELANKYRQYATYYFTFKQGERVVWSDQKSGPRPDLAVLVTEGKLKPGEYQLDVEGEISGTRSLLSSFALTIEF